MSSATVLAVVSKRIASSGSVLAHESFSIGNGRPKESPILGDDRFTNARRAALYRIGSASLYT